MFSFPNPVNDYAARTVATGVVLMCLAAIALDQPWILIPLTYGFWARVPDRTDAQSARPAGHPRVVAPLLPVEPKLVPGPPKRFAQAVGVVFSTTALVLWYGFGEHTAVVRGRRPAGLRRLPRGRASGSASGARCSPC